MPEIERYELIFFLCFEVFGKNLSPKIANPLIADFHSKLDNFRYESHPFKIVPITVNSFMVKEINESKIIGSYQIKFDIIDYEKENSMFRKNNEVRPLLTRLVKKMGAEIGVKQFRIILRVVNTRFQDDFKDGIWPDLSDIQSTGL